jgi:hypothetical protein
MPPRNTRTSGARWGGGSRQRHEAIATTIDEPTPVINHSRLARLLITKLFWGHVSMALIMEISAAAFDDGLKHEDIANLRGLGVEGTCPVNGTRDLYTIWLPAPLEAALSTVTVPWRMPGKKISFADVKLLLPHRVFAVLYHLYPLEFARRMYGSVRKTYRSFGIPNKTTLLSWTTP